MPKLTFHPIGNADCCRIDLGNGKKILFDYADTRSPDDEGDLRCNLQGLLRADLEAAGRDYYDAVAFTHLDSDHYKRSTEFFWLEHDSKYQSKSRIKINLLWVPAGLITEDPKTIKDDEGRILQQEARYRFKRGERIRVFSRPDRLKDWCGKNGIDFEKRRSLITDAGWCAPEFSKLTDGVEFFVHSPFAKRLNESQVEDRNDDSIVMQAAFIVGQVETKVLLMGDATHGILSDIVDVTRAKGRESRLEWDVAKLPHHCSYLSLGPEKGKDKTEPVDQVKWLFEQGRRGGTIISTSKPIPANDDDDQPPHRQAANYHRDRARAISGEFKVTMEHPKPSAPEPLVIQIDGTGATAVKRFAGGSATILSRPAPRAGSFHGR